MAVGGRLFIISAAVLGASLVGVLAAAAPPDSVPYVPAFQDLEISNQSGANTVLLVGGGFRPNSEITVRIAQNDTGDVVHESIESADATGRTNLDIAFEEPLLPGAYTATIAGATASGEAIQLTGSLSITVDFAATTDHTSATTAKPTDGSPASSLDVQSDATHSTSPAVTAGSGTRASDPTDRPTTAATSDDTATAGLPSSESNASTSGTTADVASEQPNDGNGAWIVLVVSVAVLGAAASVILVRRRRS